jgi:hypothetical protein
MNLLNERNAGGGGRQSLAERRSVLVHSNKQCAVAVEGQGEAKGPVHRETLSATELSRSYKGVCTLRHETARGTGKNATHKLPVFRSTINEQLSVVPRASVEQHV